MNAIVQELERHRRDEQASREASLAADVRAALSLAPTALDAATLDRFAPFATFCTQRGVSHLPARPETVAAFLLSRFDMPPPVAAIIDALAAIEAVHDANGMGSPIRSPIVGAALERWGEREPPRSWSKADRLLFAQLPLLVQHVISRRETQRDNALHTLQNKIAEAMRDKFPMTDEGLVKLATAFRRGFLGADGDSLHTCYMCMPLNMLLTLRGLRSELCVGTPPYPTAGTHYWIELEDGRVLDPTADQFNGDSATKYPEIYLGEPTEIHPRSRAGTAETSAAQKAA